jgi:signal transduction histidine kinase
VSTPGGLPIKLLAQVQWVETAELSPLEKREAMARCMEESLREPTTIVPQMLRRFREMEEELPADPSRGPVYDVFAPMWEQQETIRAVHESMFKTLRGAGKDANPPAVFWFNDGKQTDWLAVMLEERTNGTSVLCRRREEIHDSLTAAIQLLKLPAAFGASAEIAGRLVDLNDSQASSALTGTAERARNNQPFITANIHVVDPSVFAKRVRARLLWFASLIAAAAVAAGIGLATAWRAFRRQQALADMKTNFVSSVSHELRAPIASVRLLAEGLQRGTASNPEKQQEYYGFIVQECRRLSALIENVLDFSRIEHGRKQYEFDLTDASSLVRQTVAVMQPYAVERGIKIIPRVQENVVMNADGRAIQQALVNLIDNAVKHSPAHSEIVVELEMGAADNGTPGPVSLHVRDCGEGIPAEDHQRIFERFYRRGSELRRETQGVGIGLSIVKHIVEAHDGTVTVESAVGKGSRFTIELPGRKGTGKPQRH